MALAYRDIWMSGRQDISCLSVSPNSGPPRNMLGSDHNYQLRIIMFFPVSHQVASRFRRKSSHRYTSP